jgi:hypothetical protein
MVSKTVHVYASGGAWTVRSEGVKGRNYPTQREAIAVGMAVIRSKAGGQLVVHGRNGQIRQQHAYKMTPIQDPPKKSRWAKKIRAAVGKVALRRLQSDPYPPRDHAR